MRSGEGVRSKTGEEGREEGREGGRLSHSRATSIGRPGSLVRLWSISQVCPFSLSQLGSISHSRPGCRGGLVHVLNDGGRCTVGRSEGGEGRTDPGGEGRAAPLGGLSCPSLNTGLLSQARILTVVRWFRTIWIGISRKSSASFGDFSADTSQTGRPSTAASKVTVRFRPAGEGQRGEPPRPPLAPWGEAEWRGV